jgi:hypothetical protein
MVHALQLVAAMKHLALPLFVLGIGCGSGSDGTDPGLLIGQWSECDGSGDATFVFGADGSFSFSEDAGRDRLDGTFEVDGTTVFVAGVSGDGTDVDMEYTWYANDQFFVLGAAYPRGDHDGPVGTWFNHVRIDDGEELFGFERTMELRADNTGSISEIDLADDEPLDADGTWGPDSDENNQGGFELEIEIEEGFTVSLSFQIIDDAVLGSPSFCRD